MQVYITKVSDFLKKKYFFLQPKIANIAKPESCEQSQPYICNQGPGPTLGPLKLYGFSVLIMYILSHSRDSFSLISDIYFNTKNG